MLQRIRPIHPFPARMAPELAWEELKDRVQPIRVLDPMAGSGTTLAAARLHGHQAIGFDTDPLAVLIAATWVADYDAKGVSDCTSFVLAKARDEASRLEVGAAYPIEADEETRKYIDFWFDEGNRVELTALGRTIANLPEGRLRNVMWCALSRLIITKEAGVSLAMDVSHSRPHRVFRRAPHRAFEYFEKAIRYISRSTPFGTFNTLPAAHVATADARKIPLDVGSADVIITSPPYLNAIDYLRGHRMALVWMGYTIGKLRILRSSNVGTEVAQKYDAGNPFVEQVMREICSGESLEGRERGMLRRYVRDIHLLLAECFRVLSSSGKGVFVVGDCNVGRTFVGNSKAIEILGTQVGFWCEGVRRRPLLENRRYLPPPEVQSVGQALQKRLREEVVITLRKA